MPWRRYHEQREQQTKLTGHAFSDLGLGRNNERTFHVFVAVAAIFRERYRKLAGRGSDEIDPSPRRHVAPLVRP